VITPGGQDTGGTEGFWEEGPADGACFDIEQVACLPFANDVGLRQ